MAENKTKPTDASVEEYIASRANAQQRADCRELMALFKKITGQVVVGSIALVKQRYG